MAIGNPDRWVTYLEQHNVHVPAYTIKDNMVLFEHPSDITDVDLIQIAMQKETNGDVYMRGSVIGSPGSRFCTIKTPQKVISSYIDKQTNWIDYYEKQGTESHIKVLKRSFNHGKDRIKFDYGFIVAKNTTDFSVTVECLHGTESSGFYKELKKAPRWMHDTGRNGFYISKTIALQ
jgi:hypothetical protein